MEIIDITNELPEDFKSWFELYKYAKYILRTESIGIFKLSLDKENVRKIYTIHPEFLKAKCFDEIMDNVSFDHKDIKVLKFSTFGYGGNFNENEKESIGSIFKLLHSLV